VRDDLVIRLRKRIQDEDVELLNNEFGSLVKKGRIEQRGAYSQEDDHLELPRIAFTHTRRNFGRVRRLIDAINECEPVE